ncbi:MAG: malate dehydrogenase [Gammaproteobacteria bacterium]|nr:malate dehydrogenase [Gammaproteobacteria bacterium]MCW8928436.1 malate dehydrogenase [Gammaproteobacteria bacterium]MCW8959001.1 malate dehydrogenase [Gammaproteobacteria bacterium]MCW8973415.1 malate dehydrogenase [Gammaproteobacteria bacterium]MCW8992255.1 malate dehydrogenase [Gammaproteobacteria bacterium]
MQRRKIAIIGGGQIGSILTLMATQKELADVVLVDLPDQVNPVKGKTLDIDHLRPHIGVDINLSATSDYQNITGADVVIVTAGIPRKPNMSREDLLDINLEIIKEVAKKIKQHSPDAFIIIATNPVDTMSYAFQRLSGFPRNQVVGLSGALDTGRFQYFIAEETGLSVKDVSCMVMGGHGPTMMPLIRTASIAGIPITNLLSPQQLANIVKRTKEAGTEIVNLLGNGSAFFSSAASIMEMIEAYLGDKKRVISSSALCRGEYGVDGYYLGVPCVIGADGMERVIEVELTEDEKMALNTTAEAVSASISQTGL